jgi:RNA polymerase sigma-32 factor
MNQEMALTEIQDQMNLQEWASKALDTLNPREKYIIQKRILSEEPETLKELGERFGVTRERARQIERAALQKLKGNYLHSELAAA